MKKTDKPEILNDLLVEKDAEIEKILGHLNDKQRIFVENYCRYLSKTRAAIAAGYSEASAGQLGYAVYHSPTIYNAIQAYFRYTAIAPEENIKLIKARAETNIADYFIDVPTTRVTKTKVSLSKVILQLKQEIYAEDDFLFLTDGLRPWEITESMQKIRALNLKIQRHKYELNHNPQAFRWQLIETEATESILDVKKLIADRIPLKSVKHKKDGIEVETYSAEAAQEQLGRINGSFEKDNLQKPGTGPRKMTVEVVPPKPVD